MKPAPQLPIFYINLDSRPDRRQFMEEQFARLGIRAERVSALTTADVPAELIAYHDDPGILWPVSPADLACGLSHQLIWRRMVDEGLPAALVLEDDALLHDSLGDFLAPGLSERLGFDLLKLETRRNSVLLGAGATTLGGVELRELQSSQMGSAAYIISRAAAQASLAHPLVNAMSVDRFLFGKGGLHLLRSRILQTVPTPVVQLDRLAGRSGGAAEGPGRSDIRELRLKRNARRSMPNLSSLIAFNAAHTARLVGLIARDPGAVRRKRQAVPFAGDSNRPEGLAVAAQR